MPLVVFNLTTAPVTLSNGHGTVVPAGPGGGQRGKGYYTSGFELQGLSSATYVALQAQVDAGLVEYDWSTGVPEFFIGALEANPSPTVVSPVDLYVSPTGDDNANNGTSAASPFLTWDKALIATPAIWRDHCRHHLAAGTIQIGANLNPAFQTPAPGSTATPLVLLGDTPTLVASDSAAAGSTTTVVNATVGGFGVDALRGAALRFTSGALNGARVLVRSNTANTISLNSVLGSAPVAGVTFIVERPSTILTWPAGATVWGNAVILGMRDIKIVVPAGGNLIFVNAFFMGAMENVEIDLTAVNAGITVNNTATCRFYGQGGPWTAEGANNPFSALRQNCGVYMHGPAAQFRFITMMNNCEMLGNYVMDNISLAAVSGARFVQVQVGGLSARSCAFTADEGGQIDLAGVAALSVEVDGSVTGLPTPGAQGLVNYGRECVGNIANAVLKNGAGHAVVAGRNSLVSVGANVSGSNNGQALQAGAAASIIAGAAAGNARISGIASLAAAYVGDRITLSGCATAAGGLHGTGNNDTFTIVAVGVGFADVQMIAGFPLVGDANNGAIGWTTVGGVGLRTANGGFIDVSIAAGAIQATVTGTGGDTLNGNQTTTKSYATVFSAGGNGESDNSGPSANRIGLLQA